MLLLLLLLDEQVALHGDVPCALHGGPLLGVALKRLTSSAAELSGEDASPVMQFYSWNGVTKVCGGGGATNTPDALWLAAAQHKNRRQLLVSLPGRRWQLVVGVPEANCRRRHAHAHNTTRNSLNATSGGASHVLRHLLLPACGVRPCVCPSCCCQVGPELPEPSLVSWDPTLRYVALAYLRQVQVLSVQPSMQVLGSLPIVGTTCAVWGVRQLYVATPTSILLAFVAAEEPAAAAAAGGARVVLLGCGAPTTSA